MSGTRFPFIIGHPPTSIYMAGNETMDKQANAEPVIKKSTVNIDGKEFNIVSYFEGGESGSKALCDLAVSRILYEIPACRNAP